MHIKTVCHKCAALISAATGTKNTLPRFGRLNPYDLVAAWGAPYGVGWAGRPSWGQKLYPHRNAGRSRLSRFYSIPIPHQVWVIAAFEPSLAGTFAAGQV